MQKEKFISNIMFPERRREMIKLDEESVSKIIKIAMSNNQKCNICEFRGMCFFCLFMSQQ